MAPPTSTTSMAFDYRTQVLDNCEFFIGNDIVSVITAKDAVGNYKAYAIRSNDESREALLSSDAFDTVQRAIESLHTKSCEAVQQYITTNGFSNPPDLGKVGLCSDDDDDATSEITRCSTSSATASSDGELNSSDDEAMAPGSAARNRHADHKTGSHSFGRKGRKPPTAADKPRRSRSRSSARTDQDDSDDETRPPRVGGYGFVGPMRPPPGTYRPPPPPPAVWTGSQAPMRSAPGAMPHYQQSLPPVPYHAHPSAPPSFGGISRYVGECPNPGPAPAAAARPGSPGRRPPMPMPMPMSMPMPMPRPPTTTTHTSNASASASSASSSGGSGNTSNSGVATPNTSASAITAITASAPASQQQQQQQQRLYDVCLTIRWLRHGEQRIIENLWPSLRSLQEAALRYVRAHPHAFAVNNNGSNSGSSGSQATAAATFAAAAKTNCLRSCVRQAVFGSEAYDMSTYRGDDLGRLFAALSPGGVPRFEVDVDLVGGSGKC